MKAGIAFIDFSGALTVAEVPNGVIALITGCPIPYGNYADGMLNIGANTSLRIYVKANGSICSNYNGIIASGKSINGSIAYPIQ